MLNLGCRSDKDVRTDVSQSDVEVTAVLSQESEPMEGQVQAGQAGCEELEDPVGQDESQP